MLCENTFYEDHDTHKTRKLDHYQPDYTITRKHATLCWFQAFFFIELKGDLSYKDQLHSGAGQIVMRIKEAFYQQPQRKFVFSVLTDFDRGFMLWHAKRNDDGEIEYKRTNVCIVFIHFVFHSAHLLKFLCLD